MKIVFGKNSKRFLSMFCSAVLVIVLASAIGRLPITTKDVQTITGANIEDGTSAGNVAISQNYYVEPLTNANYLSVASMNDEADLKADVQLLMSNDADTDVDFSEDGDLPSQETNYYIESLEQWNEFVVASKEKSYADATVHLMTDIEWDGTDFAGIGSLEVPFAGTFDGHGYAITKLSSTTNGLFVAVEGATIQNLAIGSAKVAVEESAYGIGILIGRSNGATVENVVIASSKIMTPMAEMGELGGMIGSVSGDTTISNSKISRLTIKTEAMVTGAGGFVGKADARLTMQNCDIANSYVKNTFVAEDGPMAIFLGGVVGEATGPVSATDVNAVAMNLQVASPTKGMGTMAGYLTGEASTFERCSVDVSTLNMSIGEDLGVGGFAGWVESPSVFKDSFVSNVKVNAKGNGDGIGGFIGNAASTDGVTLTSCLVKSTVVSGKTWTGEVIGKNASESSTIAAAYYYGVTVSRAEDAEIYTCEGIAEASSETIASGELAWNLNTVNGTVVNSKVWSQGNGPRFATDVAKATVRVAFTQPSGTTYRHTNGNGFVTVPTEVDINCEWPKDAYFVEDTVVNAIPYETAFQTQMDALYQEYFVNNDCAGKGGTLLLGHSHFDPWFWPTWEAQTGLSKYVNGYNVGIGGTSTTDWFCAYDTLVKPFNADRFLISLGENDINVGNSEGADVVTRLEKLFKQIHKDHPDAEIYYVYSLPAVTKYVDGQWVNPKYEALVNGEKVLCESLDYVQGIDTFGLLVDSETKNVKTELYGENNDIHLNADGYVVWSDYLYDKIFKGQNFGVTVGEGLKYKTSSGVELYTDKGENATITMFGSAPRYAYFNDTFTDKFYYETEVNVSQVLNNDAWPKFGLMLHGKTENVKFYVDMTPEMTASQVGVVHQATGMGDDWANNVSKQVDNMKFTGDDKVKLAVARDGKDFYFYVNDELVIWQKDALQDEKGAVGMFSFNTVFEAMNYKVFADSAADEFIAKAKAATTFFGSANGYSTSEGIDLSKDTGANQGTTAVTEAGTKYIYTRDLYCSDYYFETKVHVNDILDNEDAPKFGLFAEDNGTKEFFYVDVTSDKKATTVGVAKDADWDNAITKKVSGMKFAGEDEYITLGLIKEGGRFKFYVNGEFALAYDSALSGNATVGVFGINTGMTLKEYFVNKKEGIDTFITLNTEGTIGTIEKGGTIWTDKTYTFYEMPTAFLGESYIQNVMKSDIEFKVLKDGYIYVLTPYRGHANSVASQLDDEPYNRIETPAWYLASFTTKVDTWAYERQVKAGETISIAGNSKWHMVVVSELPIDPTVHEVGDGVFSNNEMAILEPTTASGDTVGTVKKGVHPFSDRTSGTNEATFNVLPYCMQGKDYISSQVRGTVEATVTKGGKVLMLGSTSSARKTYFTETLGFTYIADISEYSSLISGGSYSGNGYGLYLKEVTEGETISLGNSNYWFVPMFYSNEKLPAEPAVSFEITKMPDKLVYKLGEDLDVTGMVVEGTDKYGNVSELDATQYVAVPTTFTADVYAAAVIVNDKVQAIPVTITDENGNAIADTNEYSTKDYATQKAPLLNGSVKRSTTADVIAAIKKMEADGATAFNVHLTELAEEYRNAESFRQIAECTTYPVMAIAYGSESNREWRIGLMKTAVEAGFDIVDIPMNTFDDDSRSTLAGTVFETANPKEVSMNADVIEQQKALIQEFHDLGAEVLMSAHIGVSLTEAEGVALAKEMEARGADVAKIVLGSSANANQKELMQTNLTLKNELNIKFYYNASGNASKPYRTASALFGTHMVFCYAEYHPTNLTTYDYIVDLVEFYNTIPRLKESKPILRANNSASLAPVAVGATVWNNKDYVFTSLPKEMIGKTYVKAAYGTSGETVDVTVLRPGYIYVMTNAYKMTNSQAETLDELNYTKLDVPTWQFCNFTSTTSSVWVYEKYVEAGETLQLGQWSVVIASDEKLDLTDNGGYTVPDSEMAMVKSLSDQTIQTLEVGGLVFSGGTSSTYKFYGVPYWLAGKNYIVSHYKNGGELEVTRAGKLYMMANATDARITYFTEKGFSRVDVPDFEPFGGSSFGGKGYALYEKQVEVGEVVSWDQWAIPICSGELILADNLAMLEAQGDYTQISKFEFHARLFSDRTFYETTGSPEPLYGLSYLYAGIDNDGGETATGVVTKAGTVYIQIPTDNENSTYVALEEQLLADGFTQTPYRTYRNNVKLGYAQRLYQKEVAVGDVIHYGKYNLVFFDTLENEEDYYVMPSLTTAAKIYNNPKVTGPTDAIYTYETSDRNWQGCPVITITDGPNGKRLWSGWFTGGATELATGNFAVLLYSDDNGETWVDPAVAIIHPDVAAQVTKPQVWALEDGRLWVSWTQHTGTGGFDGKMGTWAAICENPGANPEDMIWTTPTRLFDGRGNGKITVLENGEWLTTAFDWMERNYSKVYSSVDGGQTWTFKGKAEVTGSTYNNSILLEKKDSNGNNYLWMVMRQLEGNMKESFSYDGGVTWTNGKTSSIAHPNSAIYIGWTSTGKLLMINHKDFTGRNNLTAFLSDDGGETWKYTLLLDERSGVSYPDVVEDEDGTFYIVYDYDRFDTGQMFLATVTEEDIMAGKFQSSVARQKVRYSSLGISDADVSENMEKVDLSYKYTWSSSTGNIGASAHAAFDGNYGTRWCASDNSFPQTLSVDLGEQKDIAKMNILFEQEGEWQYVIRISQDGKVWNDYATNPTEIPRQQEYAHEDVTNARYVSIELLSGGADANGGTCWASIWEMSILDAEGNNLALNKPCKATSSYPNNNSADMAFDGNEDTRYCASGSSMPQQLMIDLEEVYDLGAIYMYFEQKADWDYTIETSVDGVVWDLYAQPGAKSLVSVTETKDAQARYVRLTVNGSTGGAWASVWEMEIYSYKK